MDQILYNKTIKNGGLTYIHKLTTNPADHQHESYMHDTYQLYFLISGDVDYTVEREHYSLHEGDLLFFNNKEIHRPYFLSDKEYERVMVFFSKEFFSHYHNDVYPIMKYFENKKPGSFNILKAKYIPQLHLNERFTIIEKLFDLGKPSSEILIEIEVIKLIVELNEILDSMKDQLEFSYSHDEKIEQIIQYLNQNYTKKITINDIEESFYINRFYFSHQFKKITGMSYKNYIIKKRIAKACELLRLNIKPSQVAEMVGFIDYSNFYRAFKKSEGISPSKY